MLKGKLYIILDTKSISMTSLADVIGGADGIKEATSVKPQFCCQRREPQKDTDPLQGGGWSVDATHTPFLLPVPFFYLVSS